MSRRALLGAGLALGAVGVAIVLAWGPDADDTSNARPDAPDPRAAATLPLPRPAPEVADGRVRDYLEGPGAAFLQFRELAEPLAGIGDSPSEQQRAVCRDVADGLNAVVDLTALLEVAQGIPDPVLAELAVSDRTAVAQALAVCLGNAQIGIDLEHLLLSVEASDVLIERRLAQL